MHVWYLTAYGNVEGVDHPYAHAFRTKQDAIAQGYHWLRDTSGYERSELTVEDNQNDKVVIRDHQSTYFLIITRITIEV